MTGRPRDIRWAVDLAQASRGKAVVLLERRYPVIVVGRRKAGRRTMYHGLMLYAQHIDDADVAVQLRDAKAGEKWKAFTGKRISGKYMASWASPLGHVPNDVARRLCAGEEHVTFGQRQEAEARRLAKAAEASRKRLEKIPAAHQCHNAQCRRHDAKERGGCTLYNNIGRMRCNLRVNPDQVPCKFCGAKGEEFHVIRTLGGWLCKNCRGSCTRHIRVVRRLGGFPTFEGKPAQGGKADLR